MPSLKQTIKKLAAKKFDSYSRSSLLRILSDNSITFLDVGAANGAPSRWSSVAEFIDYFGVEPDPRSTESVISPTQPSPFKSKRLITNALWDDIGTISLNLCRKPMTSSVFEPNREFARLFPEPERFDVLEQIVLPSTTIDQITQNDHRNFDAMKLDIQGSELKALSGAKNSLTKTFAIEVEVEFCQLYVQQPLFDRVFSFLNENGFDLIDLLSIYRWSPNKFTGLGQMTFADALFMRSPENITSIGNELAIRKYAAISIIYRRGDLLLRLADACDTTAEYKNLAPVLREIGATISAKNQKAIKFFNFASRIFQIANPYSRTYFLH